MIVACRLIKPKEQILSTGTIFFQRKLPLLVDIGQPPFTPTPAFSKRADLYKFGQSKFPYYLLHLRSLLPTTIPCFTHPSKPDLE